MKKWPPIALLVVIIDQAVKFLLVQNSFPGLVLNRGIAFGFFPSDLWTIINLFIIILSLILINKSFAKSLIIGGGMSNIIDRITRGYVVDYINLPIIPTFNLADWAITIGIGFYVFEQLNNRTSEQ